MLCFFVWNPMPGHTEVLDRIVAVVDGRIITLSDLRQERETRAILGEKSIDDDPALTKQLVDTYLIERQTAEYPGIEVTDSEISGELRKAGLFIANSPSDLSPGRVLANEQGLILAFPYARVHAALSRRIRIQKFFDIRFRQLIRPTDDEIRAYYEQVFVPEAKTRGLKSIPPLTDPEMLNAVRENVRQESLDHEVDVWLEAIRRRSNVEVFQ
jgi:hypothetical protein